MQFHVLATDFDGTIAEHGVVPQSTFDALHRVKDSGRHLILVTGRRLEPLVDLIPDLTLFDLIVAENGVLLFNPHTQEEKLLAAAPPEELFTRMRERGVDRLEQGRVIVATWRPFETIALDIISELAIDLQIIFNKDAVMLLPSGCNKALGLKAALKELQISPLNTICVGDAENDEAMMRMVGCSVAVANALDPVKEMCDYVTRSPRGAGVEELCAMILDDDLQSLNLHAEHAIAFGRNLDESELTVPMTGQNLLVTGGPGGGKSKFAMHFLSELSKVGAQACIIDPEGDYQGIDGSITLGSAERAPSVDEVINLLEMPGKHCIVSLFAVQKRERPEYFNRLLHGLIELRSRTARPHWIIVDEAHYAAPVDSHFAEKWNPEHLKSILFITAFDDHVSNCILETVDWVVSISDTPLKEIQDLARQLGEAEPISMNRKIMKRTVQSLGIAEKTNCCGFTVFKRKVTTSGIDIVCWKVNWTTISNSRFVGLRKN